MTTDSGPRDLAEDTFNPYDPRNDAQGRPVWGSEGVIRPDTTSDGTEWQFTHNGQSYFRLGKDKIVGPGSQYQDQVIYDPKFGYGIPTSLAMSEVFAQPQGFFDQYGPMLAMAAMGG